MNTVLQEYIPNNPSVVFSSEGYRRVKINSGISFHSSAIDEIGEIELHSPESIDVSWSNGNIYVANKKDKKVYKIDANGKKQKSLQLQNPTLISISQNTERAINNNIHENKIWVANGSNIAVLDSNMDINMSINGIGNIESLCAYPDGCYIADNDKKMLIKINSFGETTAFIRYLDFLQSYAQERIVSIKSDYNEYLWVLSDVNLYKIEFSNNEEANLIKQINLQTIVGQQYVHNCLDIERWAQNYTQNESSSSLSESTDLPQYIYTASGNQNDTVICKFDGNGNIVQKKVYLGYKFPLSMKVSQNRYSKSIMTIQSSYMTNQPNNLYDESSSSSSSSSLTPGYIWASCSSSNKLFKINTNDFSKTSYDLSFNILSIAYNVSKNILYTISANDGKIYWYDTGLNTTTIANNTFSTTTLSASDKISLILSSNSKHLWLLWNNNIIISNEIPVDNTIVFYNLTWSLLDENANSIGICTGVAISPDKQKTYFCTRDAIWWTWTNNISIDKPTNIICSKLVNKPSGTQNGIQDILFTQDDEMLILDSYVNNNIGYSNLWKVNYKNPTITYQGVFGWTSPVTTNSNLYFEDITNEV